MAGARRGHFLKKHGLEVEGDRDAERCGGHERADRRRKINLFANRRRDPRVSAAVGGADVVVIGTTIGTLVQNLMVRPEIEKSEQLRGKSIGITRFGTTIDTGSAHCATPFRARAGVKDVSIIQIGGMESIVPAMAGGPRARRHPFLSRDRTGQKSSAFRELARHRLFEHALCIRGHLQHAARSFAKNRNSFRKYMTAQVEANRAQ